MAALLRPHLHPGNGIHQQLLGDLRLPAPGSQDSRLIHYVFQLRAGGEGHALGHVFQVHVRGQLLPLAVHLQDGYPPGLVGIVHRYLAVKAARAQQSGVQNVPAVGGRHHNHALVDVEAVHFHQQLIQRLFPFIVSATQARATMAAHGVNFIDKHNGGRRLFGLLKHITHAAGAYAHKHFHKVRAGNGKERHVGFPRHRLGQQGFARTGRAHQQHALGNAGAHGKIVLGVAQEIHHFLQFFLFLVGACHVGKGNLVPSGLRHARPALAKVHHLAVSAGLGPHQQVPQAQEEQRCHNKGQEADPPRRLHRSQIGYGEVQVAHGYFIQRFAFLCGLHLTHGQKEIITNGGFKIITLIRELGGRNAGILQQPYQLVVPDGHLGHLIVVDHLEQRRIFNALAGGLHHAAIEPQRQ